LQSNASRVFRAIVTYKNKVFSNIINKQGCLTLEIFSEKQVRHSESRYFAVVLYRGVENKHNSAG
jgi:hypothetical protein